MAAKRLMPLLVILGATGTGKSALALEVAKKFNGEIVAADSRTIYKGMDIGTAKPNLNEREAVPHHLIDVTTIDQPLTVAEYAQLAEQAITQIQERHKLPILVGGTGLYIDAVIYRYQFPRASNKTQRELLQKLSVEELQSLLRSRSIPLPVNPRNPRHLIRAIETGGQVGKSSALREGTHLIGLTRPMEDLKKRQRARVERMFHEGLEQEVRFLVNQYGWEAYPLQTIGYQEFALHFAGPRGLEETKEEIIKNTVHFAKRQATWFKRNESIQWVSQQGKAVEIITTILNK